MIGSRKGRTALLFFPSALSPAEHQAFTSNHSISKYITSKFLSTHIYLYRLHCKMDKESSLRGVQTAASLDVSDKLQNNGCELSPKRHLDMVTMVSDSRCTIVFLTCLCLGVCECFSEELDCNEDKALLLSASSSERHFFLQIT